MKKVLFFICLGVLTSCSVNKETQMDKPTKEQIEQYDNQLLKEVGENLIGDFPKLSTYYGNKFVHQTVRQNFNLAKRHNMVLTGSIYVLAGYQLFFGQPVDRMDKSGELNKILTSNLDELEKMAKINQRVKFLEDNKVIRPIKALAQ